MHSSKDTGPTKRVTDERINDMICFLIFSKGGITLALFQGHDLPATENIIDLKVFCKS